MSIRSTNAASGSRTSQRLNSLLFKGLWSLLALAVVVAVAASLNRDFLARVQQERELIAAGERIRDGIGAYHSKSPGTAKTYPSALVHLLADPRMLAQTGHLDYIPTDPVSRTNEWGEIKNAQGEVIGVHSLADKAPTWLGQFLAPKGSGRGAYSEWRFVYRPQVAERGKS
jgi:hypothetical protein